MTILRRILVTVIFWAAIGGLLIVNLCWGKGSIIYTVRADTVYSIGANSTKPKRLFDVIVASPSMDGQFSCSTHTKVFRILTTGTRKTIKIYDLIRLLISISLGLQMESGLRILGI